MATRSKPSTNNKVDRKKVLEEIRKSGSFMGAGGDRKTLFIRPSEEKPLRCFVLPDMQPRGTHGEKVPYLSITSHWLTRKRQDDTTFEGTITCIRGLREDEPLSYKLLLEKSLIAKNDDCVPCLLLDAVDPDDLPKDRFKQRARITPKKSFNFQAVPLKVDSDDDDPQKIKVLPANFFGRNSFMEQLYDEEEFSEKEFALFEKDGLFTTWRVMGQGRQQVSFDKSKKVWLENWKDSLLELELVCPTFLSFEDQIECVLDNVPEKFAKIVKAIGSGERPQVEKKENQPRRSRTAAKKSARSRILSAE